MRAAACLVLLVLAALAPAATAVDWDGEPTGVFRTATMDRGEWIYTDGIHQAKGANTDGLDRTEYFPLNPHGDDPTNIPRDLHNALTYDAFGSDRSARNGDYQRPTDATKYPHGTADIAELRLAVRGDALHVRFLWDAFPAPNTQIATLTFGSAASPQRAWPRNARLASGWDVALTAWGAAGVVTAADGTETAVDVANTGRSTEVVVPLSVLPAGPWTLTGGAGLTDPAKGDRYWTVPPGTASASAPGSGGPTSPTNVWSLLFADDADWTFDERRQSNDLAAGSAATATATVDPADLRANRTIAPPQRTGNIERLFTSRIDDGQGISRSGGTQIPQGNPGYGFNETWRYRGRLQPYGMRVPDRYPASDRAWPLIVYLHGFANYLDEPYYSPAGLVEEADRQGYLLASPLGRGDYGYRDEGMVDVLEVIADVRRNYDVDPDRIYLMGHSMGAYGTSRIGMRFPDTFAAIAPMQGTQSEELYRNLRNVPWYSVTSVQDLDAGGRQATAMYERLSGAGYDATLTNYGMKIHEYSSIYENLPALFRFFGANRRDANPAVVTFTRPTDDNPKLGLVFDGAYWVSGVRSVSQDAPGTVTVTSEAITHRIPDPAAAQRTREVVFDPASPSKRSVGVRYQTTPGYQPAGPTSNTLRVDAAGAATLTVDLDRAQLERRNLRIVATADAPTELTLRTRNGPDVSITLPAGASDRTL